MDNKKIITLASNSPQRAQLLRSVGLPFRVVKQNAPERFDETKPGRQARKLAGLKALTAFEELRDIGKQVDWLLAADTFIYCRGSYFGKPDNVEQAAAMLRLFSAGSHLVYSGLALISRGRPLCVVSSVTELWFSKLSETEINAYMAGGEWRQAAGGYRLQGQAALWIKKIKGTFSCVMGLPLPQLYAILKRSNYPFFG